MLPNGYLMATTLHCPLTPNSTPQHCCASQLRSVSKSVDTRDSLREPYRQPWQALKDIPVGDTFAQNPDFQPMAGPVAEVL